MIFIFYLPDYICTYPVSVTTQEVICKNCCSPEMFSKAEAVDYSLLWYWYQVDGSGVQWTPCIEWHQGLYMELKLGWALYALHGPVLDENYSIIIAHLFVPCLILHILASDHHKLLLFNAKLSNNKYHTHPMAYPTHAKSTILYHWLDARLWFACLLKQIYSPPFSALKYLTNCSALATSEFLKMFQLVLSILGQLPPDVQSTYKGMQNPFRNILFLNQLGINYGMAVDDKSMYGLCNCEVWI